MVKRIVVTGLKARGYVDGRYVGEEKKEPNARGEDVLRGRTRRGKSGGPMGAEQVLESAARNAVPPKAVRLPTTTSATPSPANAAGAVNHRVVAPRTGRRRLAMLSDKLPALATVSVCRRATGRRAVRVAPVVRVVHRAPSRARIRPAGKRHFARCPCQKRWCHRHRRLAILAVSGKKPNPDNLPKRWLLRPM